MEYDIEVTNEYSYQEDFYEKFRAQYEGLQDLGFDLISEYESEEGIYIDDDTLGEFMEYVHENYFQWKEYTYFTIGSESGNIYSRLIYKILFINMVDVYIPEFVLEYNLNSPLDIPSRYEEQTFKVDFIKYLTNKLMKIQQINPDKMDLFKLEILFMIENFDSIEFTDPYNNYFLPLISNYYSIE